MIAKDLTVLGVGVNIVSEIELLDHIKETIQKDQKKIFAYITAHAVNLARKHGWFRDFLNSADVAYADGEGIRWASWILGRKIPKTIALTRWIWDLCEYCEKNQFSIFFLGSEETTVAKAVARLQERFPALKIAGWHHGFFEKQGPENESVITTINTSGAQLLLVGFGMPLQEQWIRENIERLQVNLFLPAGSCFEYTAGVKKTCPRWLSRIGFEWLFRFFQEPGRLFTRYFIGNPRFLLCVLADRLRR